jgi:hypothetical protein
MSREETLLRITATASFNLVLIIDTMTSVVMDMIEEAKRLGIYKHERKQRLNLLMHEIQLHQNMVDRRAGDDIYKQSIHNEAFYEQILPARRKSLEAAQKVVEECGIPNASYLAYLHQVRVVGFAAYSAIRIWTKRMEEVSSPLPCEYTVKPYRPEKAMDKLQHLISFEFSKYQGREEKSKEAEEADLEFVGKLADTEMICAIMESKIKPSWVVEDEKKAEEEAKRSVEDEANNIPQECVYE